MTKPTRTHQPPDDDGDEVWFATIEKQWRASLPRYTDAELLEIFPEARDSIPEKIAEWKQERVKLVSVIKEKLIAIKQRSVPEDQWLWCDWVKWTDAKKLLGVDIHLARLKRGSRSKQQ